MKARRAVPLPADQLAALTRLGMITEVERLFALDPAVRDHFVHQVPPYETRKRLRAATLAVGRGAPFAAAAGNHDPDAHTHTCAACGAGFTPESRHQNQRTCGKVACVKAYKREYMRKYFAAKRGEA